MSPSISLKVEREVKRRKRPPLFGGGEEVSNFSLATTSMRAAATETTSFLPSLFDAKMQILLPLGRRRKDHFCKLNSHPDDAAAVDNGNARQDTLPVQLITCIHMFSFIQG